MSPVHAVTWLGPTPLCPITGWMDTEGSRSIPGRQSSTGVASKFNYMWKWPQPNMYPTKPQLSTLSTQIPLIGSKNPMWPPESHLIWRNVCWRKSCTEESAVRTHCNLNVICMFYRYIWPCQDIMGSPARALEGPMWLRALNHKPHQLHRKSSPSLPRENTEASNFKCMCVSLLGLPSTKCRRPGGWLKQ